MPQNTTCILYIAGLGTPILSNLCGIRSLLECLAEKLSADLIVATWNGVGMQYLFSDLPARIKDYTRRFLGGHSHGGDAAYQFAKHFEANYFDAAAFLDICPPWNPTAWMFDKLPRPSSCQRAIGFHQRNDLLLAGVQMVEDERCKVIDCTPYKIHHASMPAEPLVQSEIENLFLRAA